MLIHAMLLNCFLAGLSTYFLVFILKPFAKYIGLIDIPGGRKKHSIHTPVVGGIAMFLAYYALFYFADLMNHYIIFFIASAFLFFIGLIDDIKDIKPRIRLLSQFIATSAVITIYHLNFLHLGDLFFLGDIKLMSHPVIAFMIPLIAFVAYINAFNMIDGVDGLAGLIGITQCSFLTYLSIQLGHAQYAYVFALLVAVLFAYLCFNLAFPLRTHAKIFMGDAGSTFIAFVIAFFSLELSRYVLTDTNTHFNIVTVLWVLAYPLFDLTAVIISRIKKDKSPFSPGRDHLHHVLQKFFIKSQITWIITLFSVALGAVGIISSQFKISLPITFLIYLITFFIYTLFFLHLESWGDQKID